MSAPDNTTTLDPRPGRVPPGQRPSEPCDGPVALTAVPAALDVEVITSVADAAPVLAEWRDLFGQCGAHNPFVNPTWVMTWAEHFVPAGDLFVVVVRDADRLCAVAPFYRRRLGRGPARFGRSLQLIGSVDHVVLTERPQILALEGHRRRVMRRVFDVIQAAGQWDWVEVSLAADQGWFEPHWIDHATTPRAFVVHKTSRPSVGMALPGAVGDLRSSLKRNLRESLRRARNRLNRTGVAWDVEVVSSASEFTEAVEGLLDLHCARATMAGKVAHPDLFTDPADRSFVIDALCRMAADHSAEALFIRADGRRVAGLMTLLAPDAVYLSFSGVDPAWWSFSAVTLLQWEAVTRAVAAGRTFADLSVGVDLAKLRWSEAISVHPEFVVVARRRRSEIAFGAYWLACAGARAVRERNRHEPQGTMH